ARVEPHPAAKEVIGVEITEHERGIRYRRFRAPGGVAGGARLRPRALGADAQQAAGIDPGDRTTSGADALDVDRSHTGDVPGEGRARQRLAGKLDHPRAHQTPVEAGSARVAHDEVAMSNIGLGISAPRHRRHRRPRLYQVNRPLYDVVDVHNPAEGGCYEDL